MTLHITDFSVARNIHVLGRPTSAPVARWSYCARTGRLVCAWAPGVETPLPDASVAGDMADLLNALLRRHRDLRAA